MKKAIYSILSAAAIICVLASCDNGKYSSNPSSSTSSAINPLNPLTGSQYTWSGTPPLSCLVNGTPFQADSAYTAWTVDSSGGNGIIALKGGIQGIALYLKPGYSSTTPYSMGLNNYNNYGEWIDSVASLSTYFVSSLGNAGGVLITENDTVSGNFVIKGKFYFIGVSTSGAIVTITDGYFDIKKPI